ncbi:High-affinity branched-chain amino acid transport system permease protein LivH [Candidatus Entotheonellaceae bacterium PAL068K]
MDIYLLSQLFNGLIFGLLYGLIALGLTIVFSIMRVVNFAHGELYMLGGYLLYFLTIHLGLPAILGLPLCMLAVCLAGFLVERLLLRPVYTARLERAEEYAIIITFGLSLMLQNSALWGIGPYELTPASFWSGSKQIFGDLYLGGDRLFAAAMAALLLTATLLLMYQTWLGQALMATAQNRVGAAVVGIHVVRMNLYAMGLSGMLAAAAGALIAPIFLVYPDVGAVPVVKAFVVIVLGGMGSIPGSILGAVLLGLVESLGSVYIAVAYRDVYAFLVLIVVLLFRPYGLFGQRERRA